MCVELGVKVVRIEREMNGNIKVLNDPDEDGCIEGVRDV
jgi:hypothetical protein